MPNDNPSELSNTVPQATPPAGRSLLTQALMMFRAFMVSPERNTLFLLGGALVAVIGATAFGQIRLNAWNQPFYDALARRDLREFGEQIIVFAIIAGALLALNVAQMWLNRLTKVKLRQGLVRDLFDEWLMPRRAFRLVSAGEIGVNPDQRIHEDARQLTELSTDLGVGLLQSSLLLGSFIGVLWILSDSVSFDIDGRSVVIPGYLVWSALAYAGVASWLSWRVGRPLIPLNAERYAREADLRFSLVRVSEHVDAIALQGGEADEKQRLGSELDRVLDVMRRIVGATTRLTWVTAGYGWFTIIAPILVASPGYFGGDLSFGGLMMAVGAFIQVQQALRWFIDNFSTIADWRATLLRVASFREAVVSMDALDETASRIDFAEDPDGKFRFEGLEIATPTGCTMLRERQVEVAPGDRVQIVGEPGTGKTILFRAIAGLWPWGAGRILRPAQQKVAFVPRRPYVPPGTLRAALAYPASEVAYAEPELVAALQSTGLGHLSQSLDRAARWDRELSEEEQQSLSFARLRLQKPAWVVIVEALVALDEPARQRVLDLFRDGLADAALINIGRAARDHLFTRTLHLVKDTAGRTFERRRCVAPDFPAAAGVPSLPLQPVP
jgi:putative ATP-binding cassette transporter